MWNDINTMALFCEDIREEKGDVFTLVGILPDTVNLRESGASGGDPSAGGINRILTKLCVYARINFAPEIDIGEPKVQLSTPDGNIFAQSIVKDTLIAKAKKNAIDRSNLQAGIIVRLVLTAFQPPSEGTIKAEVVIKGQARLAGTLNFRRYSEPVSSRAPAPPSMQ
jgi:hypothetical protein